MLKEIFYEAQIYVRRKREILISLLSRTVCAEIKIAGCCESSHVTSPSEDTALHPPGAPFLFSGCFILDQRQA